MQNTFIAPFMLADHVDHGVSFRLSDGYVPLIQILLSDPFDFLGIPVEQGGYSRADQVFSGLGCFGMPLSLYLDTQRDG